MAKQKSPLAAPGTTATGSTITPDTMEFPAPVPSPHKLNGWDFWRKTLRGPKYVVAPMVEQSELPFRILMRRHGADLIYTPMIHSRLFSTVQDPDSHFNLSVGEEGSSKPSALCLPSSSTLPSTSPSSSMPAHTDNAGIAEPALPSLDRPLIAQMCANSPTTLLAAARMLEDKCDAVDLNLGCPQDIARRGQYGAFLMDEWGLIWDMVNTLHANLRIPVTAKFRIFPTIEKSVRYAKMLESAGAQVLTCHGRLREQRGHLTGLADWKHIAAIKRAVSIPVIANGNVLTHADLERCLKETGADAVMSAEGVLYDPLLFESPRPTLDPAAVPAPSAITLAREYISLVRALKTPTPFGAVKGHMFKILRPALGVHLDLRDKLGKIREGKGGEGRERAVDEIEGIVEEIMRRAEADIASGSWRDNLTHPAPHERAAIPGLEPTPYWVAQPYVRPPPVAPGGGKASSKKIKSELKPEKEAVEVIVFAEDDFDEAFVSVPEGPAATMKRERETPSPSADIASDTKRVKVEELVEVANVEMGEREEQWPMLSVAG